MRTMAPEEQEAFLRRDIEMTESIAARLEAAGVDVSVSPTLLAGLLRALVFIGMHRDDVGAELAPQVEEFLVDALARALTSDGRPAAPAIAGRRGSTR
jgi:hypothetical protein